ncbi:hypothetical protein [Azonexus hydrophilus]|uniref:hypothetical protein n=1 Tax=Azonexus hydrophilus TaxID=418702 RepID=UPI001115598A|nr:hypothetical protein [Azonexus hydrophilus]
MLDRLLQVERLLSQLTDVVKKGNWETIPDIGFELVERLEWLKTIDKGSMNTPLRIKQLGEIQRQLELNAKSCLARLEQIKPLIDAFAKKPAPSPDDHRLT